MSVLPEDPTASSVPNARRDADFSELALDLHEAHGSGETIDRIVDYSCVALGSDGAGVLLIHARGRMEVLSSTSPEVTQAHLAQVELGEGPCLDASVDPTMIFRVEEAATDSQWPRWSEQLLGLGFRSVLAIPLATRTRRYGSLNLYAHRPFAFDAEDEAVGRVLARHASVALAASHNIEGLNRAVDARKTIGIAMGLLMARYDIDSPVAFDVLRRYSETQNVKLRVVAERIVQERGIPQDW
jgi:GAF domain-containing protein